MDFLVLFIMIEVLDDSIDDEDFGCGFSVCIFFIFSDLEDFLVDEDYFCSL